MSSDGLNYILEAYKKDKVLLSVEKIGVMRHDGRKAAHTFGFNYGVLNAIALLHYKSEQIKYIPPITWKNHFGLIGTKKRASLDLAKKRFPQYKFDSIDVADAFWLAKFAEINF
ncbi:MAG: hypothetical protein OMM_06619 [Candidatus Magnetoglobus multicellularis str. Araruama]|uniref:Uncharacterized protein n=1 Tax=Candidatus Magnetoglobus multicellularis str. Araruama TaxID=890399 RepID=A0A1V1PGD5_9BACT|nr:MAG: hypothetical protein OMM_06619 [Candidatus Magnetoglobus multicellularis str. Araruama]